MPFLEEDCCLVWSAPRLGDRGPDDVGERRNGWTGDLIEAHEEAVERFLKDGEKNRRLAAEVVMRGCVVESGGDADVANGGRGVAAFTEEFRSRVEDLAFAFAAPAQFG